MNVGDKVNVFKLSTVRGFMGCRLVKRGVVVRRYKHISSIVIENSSGRHLIKLNDRSIAVYRADTIMPQEVRV